MKISIIGWIGMIIGILGGLLGLTVGVIAGGLPVLIIAIVFLSIFGGVFWSIMFKPMYIRRKLQKSGVAATAQILEVSDTGTTLNNNPQVKILMEVKSPYGELYKVETKVVVSRINPFVYHPGMTVPVIIDPNNKNLIVIGEGGSNPLNAPVQNVDNVTIGPWASTGKDEALRRLTEIDSKNKKILQTGISSRAIVTKYTWLGIYVNGQNPAIEMDIEVLPTDRPSFKATVQGVILETSVPKFQVGEEIFVKYNPDNVKEITVEHS
jgi:hypothetical protein